VTVDIREDMGPEVYLHFAVDAPTVRAEGILEILGEEAAEAAEEQTQHRGAPFIARVGRSSTARESEHVEVTVDRSRLHFFDLETGERIETARQPLPLDAVPA
jgi:multiple sugar transport system ATP-binding protein